MRERQRAAATMKGSFVDDDELVLRFGSVGFKWVVDGVGSRTT